MAINSMVPRICSKKEIPPQLRDSCKRLKDEEFGSEWFVKAPCEWVAGNIRSINPGSYERRHFRTADSDYDIIAPYGDFQFHYRLREVEPRGCLITIHREPSDPFWHGICGPSDLILGKNKPTWCEAEYLPFEDKIFRNIRNFSTGLKYEWG